LITALARKIALADAQFPIEEGKIRDPVRE